MEASSWEQLLLGALVILLIWWMRPGIKAATEISKQAKPDWQGLLLPLGFVVMFVIFLIAMV
jgi:hypothetical protein